MLKYIPKDYKECHIGIIKLTAKQSKEKADRYKNSFKPVKPRNPFTGKRITNTY